MFYRARFWASRYWQALYFGSAEAVVVEPPVPQPQPQSTGVFGSIRPPIVPIRPIIGNIAGALPGLSGAVVGEIVFTEGVISGGVPLRFGGAVSGEIIVYGSGKAAVGALGGQSKGMVKALHDDEEMLLLLLAA